VKSKICRFWAESCGFSHKKETMAVFFAVLYSGECK
jgi:hypothetical protein